MDPANNERWNAWAAGIAIREAREAMVLAAPDIAKFVKRKTTPLEVRIAELEGKLAAIEAKLDGNEVIEWPLPDKGRAA